MEKLKYSALIQSEADVVGRAACVMLELAKTVTDNELRNQLVSDALVLHDIFNRTREG